MPLAGKPLLQYSIEFAHRLPVDEIVCSTDSPEYAKIAQSLGASVPRLRSQGAAVDAAMEEDVIDDMSDMVREGALTRPDILVWLRPTFVFRSISATIGCIDDVRSGQSEASRVVCAADPRIYVASAGFLKPSFDSFGRSMVRRQELPAGYKVFNVDVFCMPVARCPQDFLGQKVLFRVAPKICGLDIDDIDDFAVAESLLQRIETAILP